MPAHASDQPLSRVRVRCAPFAKGAPQPCRANRLGADGDAWGASPPARVGVHALGGGVDAPSTQRHEREPSGQSSLPAGTSSSGSCPRRCVLGPSADARTQRREGREGGCSHHADRRSGVLATGSRRAAVTSSMAARLNSTRLPMRMAGTPARWPSRAAQEAACETEMPSARAASERVIVRRSLRLMLAPVRGGLLTVLFGCDL